MTGTGIVPDATFTLQDGDVVGIQVSGLGVLENTVETIGTPLNPR
jgi:2-dehydro-3-deoxy-D-arabinonate dehydratase